MPSKIPASQLRIACLPHSLFCVRYATQKIVLLPKFCVPGVPASACGLLPTARPLCTATRAVRLVLYKTSNLSVLAGAHVVPTPNSHYLLPILIIQYSLFVIHCNLGTLLGTLLLHSCATQSAFAYPLFLNYFFSIVL